MNQFIASDPTLDGYWRGIILFGMNTASYKFALGKSLLHFSQRGQNFITLEELAVPFAQSIADHLKLADRQSTNRTSKFLEACKDYNTGQISDGALIDITTQTGFRYVIDAFHIVNQIESPLRFYVDERKNRSGIELTEEIFQLQETFQAENFPQELEARWRLIETAWSLRISPNLLFVEHDKHTNEFFTSPQVKGRVTITSSRDALNGYQKGKCFFCFSEISIETKSKILADVDHFFPHSLKSRMVTRADSVLDGIWNLVLTCKNCNRGVEGKFARVPKIKYLERLNKRNNFLIDSHHPLRETLIRQTGNTEGKRREFLQEFDNISIQLLIHRWEPSFEHEAKF